LIYFLDASALVKRYVSEPGTEDVRRLVRGRRRLAASSLSALEVPSALARRVREGHLPREAAMQHARRVATDLAEMHVVAVRSEVLSLAADLVWRHPLRAYDAAQLASALRLAREGGLAMTFVCADGRLTVAARAEGLRAMLLGRSRGR